MGRGDPAWPDALQGAIDQCLASRPTALLVHADREAVALVERCRVRGIRVPDDLAIITYDDEVATLCDPPLTAVRPPKAEIGGRRSTCSSPGSGTQTEPPIASSSRRGSSSAPPHPRLRDLVDAP